METITCRKELRKFVVGKVLDVGIKDAFFWGGRKPDNVVGLDLKNYGFTDVIGDARALPFKDKSFDTVVMTEVIEHIPPEDRDRVIQELQRVARKIIIISAPSREEINLHDNEEFNPHWRNPEWLFDLQSFVSLVQKFRGRKRVFRISNKFYEGFGAVIFL